MHTLQSPVFASTDSTLPIIAELNRPLLLILILILILTLILAVLSTGLCVTWYIFSERINWVWIVQDFLGVSVCLLFLTSVHLPNLKAAAMLLGEREGETLHPASPCCILDIEGYLNPIHFNPIQSNPLQSNPIQSNPIHFNPIHYKTIQSNLLICW
jgi:Signal peptide peptidase